MCDDPRPISVPPRPLPPASPSTCEISGSSASPFEQIIRQPHQHSAPGVQRDEFVRLSLTSQSERPPDLFEDSDEFALASPVL